MQLVGQLLLKDKLVKFIQAISRISFFVAVSPPACVAWGYGELAPTPTPHLEPSLIGFEYLDRPALCRPLLVRTRG